MEYKWNLYILMMESVLCVQWPVCTVYYSLLLLSLKCALIIFRFDKIHLEWHFQMSFYKQEFCDPRYLSTNCDSQKRNEQKSECIVEWMIESHYACHYVCRIRIFMQCLW